MAKQKDKVAKRLKLAENALAIVMAWQVIDHGEEVLTQIGQMEQLAKEAQNNFGLATCKVLRSMYEATQQHFAEAPVVVVDVSNPFFVSEN